MLPPHTAQAMPMRWDLPAADQMPSAPFAATPWNGVPLFPATDLGLLDLDRPGPLRRGAIRSRQLQQSPTMTAVTELTQTASGGHMRPPSGFRQHLDRTALTDPAAPISDRILRLHQRANLGVLAKRPARHYQFQPL